MASELVRIQLPTAPQTRLLHVARFLLHYSAAHPQVFLYITFSINPHPLKNCSWKRSAPIRVIYDKCTGRKNFALWKRWEQRRGQEDAGRNKEKQLSSVPGREGERKLPGLKRLCLESFPSHNPQHNLQCSRITGELGEKHADITCWKRFKTSYHFSLGSSNARWQLLSVFEGKREKGSNIHKP